MSGPISSASYRRHVATKAKFTAMAVDHCTLLHASC